MSGLTAASMGGLGAGTTVEAPLARAARLCKAGSPGWCEEYQRLLAQGAPTPGPASTVTEAEAAAIRDRQAQERRGGIARGMTNVGLNPALVQAARDTRDVRYVGFVPLSSFMYSKYPELRGAQIMSGHTLHKGPGVFFYIKNPSGKTVVTGLRATSSGPLFRGAPSRAAQAPQPPQTDVALTQRVVAQTNLQNQQSSLSAHAQAAKIRNQWAANRAPAPSYPQPMSSPKQNQIILATQAQQGGLGTGAKIALGSIVAVAALSLGVLVFGGSR